MGGSTFGEGHRGHGEDPVQHSDGFRARMVERMTGANPISATALAREVGVAQPTLSRWLRAAPSLGAMSKQKKKSNQGKARQRKTQSTSKSSRSWSAEEKLRVVMAAAPLSEDELGEFLRREGIHEAQLEAWTEAVTTGALDRLKSASRRKSSRASPEAKQLKALQKDLDRKDKALAEVTALLALKKKLELLFGEDEGEATTTRSDR